MSRIAGGRIIPLTGCIVLALLLARAARADEASDRRDDLYKIDQNLGYAASSLSRLETKSGTSDIDTAQGYIREVDRLVTDLGRVKADDAAATKVVDRYPGFVRDFGYAAEALRKIKVRQPRIDDYLRSCQALNAQLTAKAAEVPDNASGLADLSSLAKSMGRQAADLTTQATSDQSDQTRGRDEVRRFSASDDRWNDVRTAFAASADAIAQAWADGMTKGRVDCDPVAQRERHPAVERALNQLANSEQGRKDIRAKLDEMVVSLADRLTRIAGASDAGYIDASITILDTIDYQVQRLSAASGRDDGAKAVATAWPKYTAELRLALAGIREMKTAQFRTDGLDQKCVDAEARLRERLRIVLADPEQHDRAVTSLPAEAEALGEPIRNGLASSDDVNYKMGTWLRTAQSVTADEGTWRTVTTNAKAAGQAEYNYWTVHYTNMKHACVRISLGAKHPDVVNAVSEMSRGTSSANASYRTLRDDFRRWKGSVDQIRSFSIQDIADIRNEICNVQNVSGQGAATVADRWAARISSAWSALDIEGTRIQQAADALVAKQRAKKAAPRTKAAVETIRKAMEGFIAGEIRGSNDPKVRALIEYGVAEHNRRQSGCDAKELTISSTYCKNPNREESDCRLDCVRKCQIVEIKPTSANSMGKAQAFAYAEGLKSMYKSEGAEMFNRGFGVFRSCVVGSELDIEWVVETYDYCAQTSSLAPPPEVPSIDIPNEAE